MNRIETAVAVLALLSLPCPCQTLVVGGGGTYTEIAAAVAAAPSGATILVRPGTYQGFRVVGKSLTILCDVNAFVAGEVFVGAIAANETVTLRGLTWASGWVPATITSASQLPTLLEVDGCQGRVLLDRLDTTPASARVLYLGVLPFWTPGLIGSTCSQLAIRDSSFRAECTLTSCTTSIESCAFVGLYEPFAGNGYNKPGLEVWGGSVRIGGTSSFQGAQGYYPGNVIEPIIPASAGLLLRADAQFVSGTAQSVMTSYPGDLGGIHVISGQLRLAPRVVVNAVTGIHPGTRTPMPSITSSGSVAAGALLATAESEPNDLIVVLVGLAGAPVSVPPFADTFWIDPNAFVFQAFGAQPSGTLTTTLPLPANPGLAGLVLTWQAIASGPATGFAVSNPSLVVLQ